MSNMSKASISILTALLLVMLAVFAFGSQEQQIAALAPETVPKIEVAVPVCNMRMENHRQLDLIVGQPGIGAVQHCCACYMTRRATSIRAL